MTESELLATPTGFACALGMRPYPWQATALEWYYECLGKRVQGSLCTPNGAGKDTVVIAALALWWIYVHARGRVIITSSDGKQIEDQTRPAIQRHRGKFDGWEFNMWTVKTPTGGSIRLYSTDDPGRVEGAHRETFDDGKPNPDGPLLIVANEAKSIDDSILDAFDRCTFDGLLYASSPGFMRGRFYESQFREELGFKRLRVGLKDCPHIPPERIAAVILKHGKDSAFARSTLDGEFMEADAELRFDRTGLTRLKEMAEAHEKRWKADVARDPKLSVIGELVEGEHKQMTWLPAADGWCWNLEGQHPIPGCRYLGFCDPGTGAQAEGSATRDPAAAGILRLAYIDQTGPKPVEMPDEIVAVLHAEGGCLWDNDIVAERLAMLLRHFKCPAVVEMNNAGMEVIRLLQLAGAQVVRRKKRDHRNPGKLLDVVGFQTTAASKALWVGALGTAIREQTFDCRYGPAVKDFSHFIRNEQGTGEAQPGCHDDFVAGIGQALLERQSATTYRAPAPFRLMPARPGGMAVISDGQYEHGALA